MKIYLIDDLTSKASTSRLVGECWYIAKPENVRYNLRNRIKAALLVLAGKATPVCFAEDVEEEILQRQRAYRVREGAEVQP